MAAQIITTFFYLFSVPKKYSNKKISKPSLNKNSKVVRFTFNVSRLRFISSLLLLIEEEVKKKKLEILYGWLVVR